MHPPWTMPSGWSSSVADRDPHPGLVGVVVQPLGPDQLVEARVQPVAGVRATPRVVRPVVHRRTT